MTDWTVDDAMREELTEVLGAYDGLTGAAVEPITEGLINQTFRLHADSGAYYVLQRLNPIFRPEVHFDSDAIAGHLAERGITVPRLLRTRQGALWVQTTGGHVYRVMNHLRGRTQSMLSNQEQAYSAGRLVGRFHAALFDFEHVFQFRREGVHDTPGFLSRLRAATATRLGHPRADELEAIADAILSFSGELPAWSPMPERIIHGDLKVSNLLFEGDEAVAIVDLDTLAHGTFAYELGDAMRSWCQLGTEDATGGTAEPFSLAHFESAMAGYRTETIADAQELDAVLSGTETVALELAARFCIDGYEDRYFAWDDTRFDSRCSHNLARAENQLALARSVRRQSRVS